MYKTEIFLKEKIPATLYSYYASFPYLGNDELRQKAA